MSKETIWTFASLSGAHVNLLRVIAILPFEGRSLDYIGSRLLSVYCYVVVFIYNTMYLWPTMKMITSSSGEVDLTIICEMIIIISICTKYIIVHLKREEFARLLSRCKELWERVRPEEGGTVKAFESKAYLLRAIMMYNAVITCVVYILTAQIVRLPPATANGTARRILPFRWYVDEVSDYYSLVSCVQSVVAFTIALIIPGVETTGLFLIMMTVSYLRCINNRLRAMSGYGPSSPHNSACDDREARGVERAEMSRKELLECVIFHQEILTYCKEIQRFTGAVYTTTVVCVLYCLSLIMVALIQSNNDTGKLLSIFVLHSCALLLCNYSPQHLINESGNVATAAYFATMEHREFDKDSNRILCIMLLRAQRPVELTLFGGYVRLSMQTFGSMMSNAFSFFTVLRNFSD